MKRTSATVYSLTAAQMRRIVAMSPSVYHIVKECRDVLAREIEILRRKGSIVGSKASERLDKLNSLVEFYQSNGLCEQSLADWKRTHDPRDGKCGNCEGGYCEGCDKTAPRPTHRVELPKYVGITNPDDPKCRAEIAAKTKREDEEAHRRRNRMMWFEELDEFDRVKHDKGFMKKLKAEDRAVKRRLKTAFARFCDKSKVDEAVKAAYAEAVRKFNESNEGFHRNPDGSMSGHLPAKFAERFIEEATRNGMVCAAAALAKKDEKSGVAELMRRTRKTGAKKGKRK